MRSICNWVLSLACATSVCSAWDYAGHRTVNLLAIEALPAEFPDFVRSDAARERVAFLGGEPDRWRSAAEASLRHANDPDHYFEFEWLAAAGIKPAEVTPFRSVFIRDFDAARKKNPESFPRSTVGPDHDRTHDLAGALPWAAAELYAKLRAAFSYLNAFREAGTPEEIANAEANILYLMGTLGHYIGDGAQPLHTTHHYNGWVGENPKGFTTADTFHWWIDSKFFQSTGGHSLPSLAARVKPASLFPSQISAPGQDPVFREIVSYLENHHRLVEPLYQLEKDGHLSAESATAAKGRAFLEKQILSAAQMLASLWYTAWKNAPPDKYLMGELQLRKATAHQP